jgi:hypothetical protein
VTHGRRAIARACACAIALLLACAADAHTLLKTQVLVVFDAPGRLAVTIGVDLSLMLGSAERYYAVAQEAPELQLADIRRVLPEVTEALQLRVGGERLVLRFAGFDAAQARRSDYLDASISKDSTFRFTAELPPGDRPLQLVVPIGARIDFPVAYTVQIPAAHVSITRWLEPGMHASDPFEWAGKAPRVTAGATAANRSAPAPATFDADSLPWPRQLALYLRLGFRHIVPEGADHILFVLGLFFLGITWRKLLSQTTVFTVAHATTLILSTYGIVRLPSGIVEPAIALSIAWIAIENVVAPQLGWTRLLLVFGFGLVHGLGFASSLSDVPFPKRDFVVALLGFNFGVDAGQLFVIGMAFLAVGWFRNRPWFRSRIAIPASLLIAATGLVWAIERVVAYAGVR